MCLARAKYFRYLSRSALFTLTFKNTSFLNIGDISVDILCGACIVRDCSLQFSSC